MRVIVTGGAGFIGSHIVDQLVEAGHQVAVVDDLSSGKRSQVNDRAQFFQCDIRDEAVARLFADFRPEALCHQAAQIDVRRSVADPAHDADINIGGSLRLLEHCRAHGTRRVVFASTGGAIYGEQDAFPADEDHPTRPVSPYGVSKLAVEHYLAYYSRAFELAATSLRYANVYGPRQDALGEAGVVAIFFDRLRSGEVPVIYGDGTQTRDFVYVKDVARANQIALESSLTGTYNVGTGVETTVNDLYSSVCAAAGRAVEASYQPARLGEQHRSCISPARIAGTTGWRPTTSLVDGLAQMADPVVAERAVSSM